jgi:hypothetical protein
MDELLTGHLSLSCFIRIFYLGTSKERTDCTVGCKVIGKEWVNWKGLRRKKEFSWCMLHSLWRHLLEKLKKAISSLSKILVIPPRFEPSTSPIN